MIRIDFSGADKTKLRITERIFQFGKDEGFDVKTKQCEADVLEIVLAAEAKGYLFQVLVSKRDYTVNIFYEIWATEQLQVISQTLDELTAISKQLDKLVATIIWLDTHIVFVKDD